MPKAIKYATHAPVWLLFYLFPYLLSHRGHPNISSIFSDSGDIVHLISFVLLIAFSYLHYFVIVPRFYLRRAYLTYITIVAACLLLVIWAPNAFEFLGAHIPHQPPPRNEPHPILFGMNYNIILFLLSVVFAIAVQSRLQVMRIEQEKLSAEVSFLKAQINPHFLFNTLNSIYALSIQQSKQTPEAIIQLADLMRYVIRDAKEDLVPLHKELAYLHNYLELQKKRLEDTVIIHYSIPSQTDNLKIVPLLLISFIENAFKHGVSPDEPSEILIQIALEDGMLKMTVCNQIVGVEGNKEEGGIGIENTVNRLQHFYPNRHTLHINSNEKMYSVNLTIELR